MKLKFKIAKLDEVAETVRSLYRQEGDSYVLDVDGAVDRSRLDEFRENNITLQKQLDKLKDVDPAKYRELMELDRKVREKELIEKGDLDGLVNSRTAAMRDELTSKLSAAETQLQAANQQLAVLMIDNAVREHASKIGVLPTAVDDVILRARALYSMKDGVAVPEKDGKVIFGKDGSTPMPIGEWVVGLKKAAPHLFQMSSGGGASGGNGIPNVDMSKLSPAQKISLGLQQGGLVGERAINQNLPA